MISPIDVSKMFTLNFNKRQADKKPCPLKTELSENSAWKNPSIVRRPSWNATAFVKWKFGAAK